MNGPTQFSQNFLDCYSDEALMAEVRRVAGMLAEGAPLTIAVFKKHARVSSSCIRRRFGLKWGEILQKAGVPNRCHNKARAASISDSQCIQALRVAAQGLGKYSLSIHDYRSVSQGPTVGTIKRLFGGWRRAVRAAGLQASGPRKVLSRAECLENLERIFYKIKGQPTYKSLSQAPSRIGPKAYERLWGKFSAALCEFHEFMAKKEVCFELNQTTRTRSYSDQDLLRELRRVGSIVGNNKATQAEVRTHCGIHPQTFARRLGGGSWEQALQRVGLALPDQAHRRHTDEEYFENLMKVWEAIGRQPRCKEMSKHPLSVLSGEAYCNRFDTWRKGILRFLRWLEGKPAEEVASAQPDKLPEKVPRPSCSAADETDYAVNQRSPTTKQRFLVMRRDGFKCVYCGRRKSDGVKLELDHKIPFSKGGKTALSNLQTLCDECNAGKGVLPEKPEA